MHVVDLDHCKKRKRGERVFRFHSFGDPACPADYYGAFRNNVRKFLEEFAEKKDTNVEGMPLWSILLREDSQFAQIPLFVIEESLQNSLHPHCDHCRCIGWSHHLVSSQRYHFIIPAAVSEIFKIETHLLHGMIHSNGFGHLLCINGREAGSKYVSGRDIMDLWDRICAMLRARKISLEDVAKKRSMEFRLLHSIAYGESWCGRWGFEFGHGSFGVTQQMYSKAIEALRGMPLTLMLQQSEERVEAEVANITNTYHRMSGQTLQTLGDLFRFMLELKARLPLQNNNNNSTSSTEKAIEGPVILSSISEDELPCRWSIKRLELATQVIVEALKKCDKRKMARQDVRDAARLYIGDTGLLDFVLKSLGNRVVGGYIVRRAVNPDTKVLEYTLQDVNDAFLFPSPSPSHSHEEDACVSDTDPFSDVTRSQVCRDIVYLYTHVLDRDPSSNPGSTAARIILDTKHFIKDYRGETTRKAANTEFVLDDDEMLRVMCSLHVADDVAQRPSPPPELVLLPPHATIGDLKREAEEALRDTYYALSGFHVDSILNLCGDDEDLLFGAIESGSIVIIRGTGIDRNDDLLYEGGSDDWIVECPCGARDDDGERMIACDMCEVWQHTRCAGISDVDVVPQLFLCNRCGINLFHSML
ncbi:PHD finger protein MALE MEIOCYTE DEATH 1-like [Cryptomeria japonica]|uniref:PHD finger protein MALE MEIOCYTE DEATH 1-like n=1 Tax=Cryptomeria japonica TaxID=3369 RepID=UPI0027DA0FE2|nr:PHD finger protein MALE MEIOCYTE DEATH 1-like [Cryptomeria japonica]